MDLDYSGIPEPEFKRELRDQLNLLASDAVVLTQVVTEDEATTAFNDIAKAFIKGDKLKKALSDLNPAAFIPVQEGAAVRASLARLGEDVNIITYGLFKTAVEFLNARGDAIDENFLISIDTIDPNEASKKITSIHKDIGDTDNDWLTDFLLNLAPLAGLTIAGYLNDLAFSRSEKVPTPDGSNSGTQTQQQHLQGIGVGIALLIEVGVTLVALDILLEPFNDNDDGQVASAYKDLKDNPDKRKEILEDAGYDYEALRRNKKFDDYMAVKQYALEYISRQSQDIQFDHWIAFVNVADNQGLLASSLAMAPMYSKKWKKYQNTSSVEAFTQTTLTEEEESELEDAVASGLNRGLRDYFGSLLQVSNDHYNKTLQVYSMMIDERLLCCILWFVGPMDVSFLSKVGDILHILGARTAINWKSLISRLGEGLARAVSNLLLSYVGMFVDKIFNDVLEKMLKIPGSDWAVAIKKCIGIDILFELLQTAWVAIFKEVSKLVASLQSMISDLGGKATASVEIAAERRWIITLGGLIQAVVDKVEAANQACEFDKKLSGEALNDIAAEAAVQFVIDNSSNIKYPVIQLSDELRNKFFKDVPEFRTKSLNLPVPGLDEQGRTESLTTEDIVSECGENGRAAEGLAIGKKIADIINNA